MVGQGLSGRCGLVVANKADLAEGRANLPRLKEEAATLGLRIVGAVSNDRLQMVVLDGLRFQHFCTLWCRARSSETTWRGLWWRCSGCAGRLGSGSASVTASEL